MAKFGIIYDIFPENKNHEIIWDSNTNINGRMLEVDKKENILL